MENRLLLFSRRDAFSSKHHFPPFSEALQLAGVDKIISSEIFQAENALQNKFPTNCQTECLSYSLNILNPMILSEPNLKNDGRYNNSQSCLTISQLIIFNSFKGNTVQFKIVPLGTRLLENSLFLCTLVLNVHPFIPSKKLIEQLHHVGISISHDRVIQIEKDAVYSLCADSQANDIVCPSHLRKGYYHRCYGQH